MPLSPAWFLTAAVPSSAGRLCPVARAVVTKEASRGGEENFRIHCLGESGCESVFSWSCGPEQAVWVRPREQTVQRAGKLLTCWEVHLAKCTSPAGHAELMAFWEKNPKCLNSNQGLGPRCLTGIRLSTKPPSLPCPKLLGGQGVL